MSGPRSFWEKLKFWRKEEEKKPKKLILPPKKRILSGEENTFYVNGTSFTPKVYQTTNKYALFGVASTIPELISDATSINGSTSLDFSRGTNPGIYSGCTWPDVGCIFGDQTTGDFSSLHRLLFTSLASDCALGGFSSGMLFQSSQYACWELNLDVSSGYTSRILDETSNAISNNVLFADTIVGSVWLDVLFTHTNSTDTSELFVDGTSLGTSVGARGFGTNGIGFDPNWVSLIYFGSSKLTATCRAKLDEMIYWNYVLDSGEIAFFDGSTRSEYYDYTATTSGGGGGGGGNSFRIGL